MARTVITIARQMGSGGDLVASELAQSLGIQLIDHEIIHAAAEGAGVAPEAISQAESAPSMLERMLEYPWSSHGRPRSPNRLQHGGCFHPRSGHR